MMTYDEWKKLPIDNYEPCTKIRRIEDGYEVEIKIFVFISKKIDVHSEGLREQNGKVSVIFKKEHYLSVFCRGLTV